METSEAYIRRLAQPHYGMDKAAIYNVQSPQDLVDPHLVIHQLSRTYEDAVEGQFDERDIWRLDFRNGSWTAAEADRVAVMDLLRRGDRLLREGSVVDLVEGSLTVVRDITGGVRTSDTSRPVESPLFRRIQEVEIEL